MFRRLSPVTEPNRESSGRPNAAPLSRILQEPSPQSHAVPLSRILASQSPLGYAPVDASGGLHAAPLSQILASPSPLQHHLPASPSFLLHHPPAPPSPLLQPHRSTTLAPVRQNSRRSRTPPRPAQIPKRGPKRKAAADLNVIWTSPLVFLCPPPPRAAPFPPAMLWTPPPILLWCSGGSLVPASRSPAHLGRSLSIRRLSSSPMRLFSNSDLGFSVTWHSRRSRRCRHVVDGSRGRVAWWNIIECFEKNKLLYSPPDRLSNRAGSLFSRSK
jgi:hypothetical protein